MQKLETARLTQAMLGERRVVTILFCDVVGSTAAAEKLDPEEWREIINGAFEHMIAPVYRYEGTLARLMGDAILAFFGAPIAHEDDPLRAILAGLEIINGITPYWNQINAQWGLEANVRVGINTGLVVVGAVGSDHKMEYTALGDAINLAARMEQTARPGTVQVSEHTYRLTEPLFEWLPLGEQTVKGKAQPIQVYQPLRTRTAPGPLRGLTGVDPPLIGRDAEVSRLSQAIRNLKDGRGGIVFIAGEAGLGKSRLLREARTIWEAGDPAANHGPFWIERRATSYDTMQAYSLIKGMLRALAGVDESYSVDALRSAIASWVQSLALPEEQSAPLESVVLRILAPDQASPSGAASGQESFKAVLFEALFNVLYARHIADAGVIVVDDLHWTDSASAEMFAHLAGLVEQVPLLFIFAARPEWESVGWELKNQLQSRLPHRFTEINLTPLAMTEGERLVQALLPAQTLPDDLQQTILARGEGNPFFVEEIVREFLENGVLVQEGAQWRFNEAAAASEVPNSIEALLTARIDRLSQSARQALQVASVIGRSFYYRVLEQVSEMHETLMPCMAELERLQMIQEAGRVPELEYAFRHALTQETAYRSILRRQRVDFHLRVGQALESLYPDRLSEFAPMLAYHFEEAGDVDRAVRYHRMAGENAYQLYATVEAVHHLDRAIALSKKSTQTEADLKSLFARKGRALELASRFEDALETYQEMEAWGNEQGSLPLVLAGIVGQAVLRCTPTRLFNAGAGEPLVERALELARSLADPETETRSLWAKMILLRLLGRNREAVEIGQYGLEIATANNLTEQTAYLLHDLGYVYAELGDSLNSSDAFKRSGVLWEELGNLPLLADGLIGNNINLAMRGDYEQAIADSQRAREISLRTRNIWGLSFSQMYLGVMFRDLGRYSEGIKAAHESIRDGARAGFAIPAPFCGMQLIFMYLDLGAMAEAEATLEAINASLSSVPIQEIKLLAPAGEGAILLAKKKLVEFRELLLIYQGNRAFSQNLQLLFSGLPEAHYHWLAEEYQEGLQYCDTRLVDLTNMGIVFVAAEVHLWRSRFLLKLGQTEAARRALAEAYHRASALNFRRLLWEIHAEMAALDELDGDHQAAEDHRRAAAAVIAYILENAPPEHRDSFLARPEVMRVMQPGTPIK